MGQILDCAASLVAYNNPPEMLKVTAESFLKTNLNVRLYVFDNSSSSELKSAFDGLLVSYYFNGKNVGYGRANNWCINNAEPSRYHLVLNPDIVIPQGALEELAKFMDGHPDIGIVCPKVFSRDGTLQHLNKRVPTVFDLFLRRCLPAKAVPLFRKRLDSYEMKDKGYDSIYEVPSLSGAFMFCRTKVLKEVGGFDPGYFLYFEDFDLSRKVQQYGFKTIYYPFVSVTHMWERAAHKSLMMALFFVASGFRYFNKWGWKFF